MIGRIAFFLLAGTIALGLCALAFDLAHHAAARPCRGHGSRAGVSDEQLVDAETVAWSVNGRRSAARLAMPWRTRTLPTPCCGSTWPGSGIAHRRGDRGRGLCAEGPRGQPGDNTATMSLASSPAAATASPAWPAQSSDLTVYGDLRDILGEGGKMLARMSEFILGLSVVGLAATVGTVATGGGGVVVKAGISLVNFAKRAGHMTATSPRA